MRKRFSATISCGTETEAFLRKRTIIVMLRTGIQECSEDRNAFLDRRRNLRSVLQPEYDTDRACPSV